MELSLDDETLQRLYAWIDEIPLSRPKKNITRDFSDGILLAEVVAYYFPKMVQMHNYSPANSVKQKQYNWTTLNRKVLRRLHLFLSKEDIDDLVQCKAGAVEHLLVKLQLKIASYKEKRPSSSELRQQFPEHSSEDDYAGSGIASPQSAASSMAASPFSGIAQAGHRTSIHSPAYPDKQTELREPQLHQQMRDLSMNHDAVAYERGYADLSMANHASLTTNNASAEAARDAAVVERLKSELVEKDHTIDELKETIQILEMKVQKLEQLVRLKDGKIQTLVAKLRTQKPQ